MPKQTRERSGGEEVLHPSRTRHLGAAGFFSLCFVLGVWLLTRADSGRVFLYAYTVFVALAAAVEASLLVRGVWFLRVGPEGLTIKMHRGAAFYQWSDIESFGVTEGRQRSVGFNLSPSCRQHRTTAARVSSFLTGFDVTLLDNYGWQVEDLAQHLNTVRDRYTR